MERLPGTLHTPHLCASFSGRCVPSPHSGHPHSRRRRRIECHAAQAPSAPRPAAPSGIRKPPPRPPQPPPQHTPRLQSRPQPVEPHPRQQAAMDEPDPRMAAFECLVVTVSDGDAEPVTVHPASAAEAAAAAAAAEGAAGGRRQGGREGEPSAAPDASQEVASLASFAAIGGPASLVSNLAKARLTRPSPVQRYGVPAIASGRDVLLVSPPGSGTTAAYLVPTLQRALRTPRLRTPSRAYPAALVVTPTRELAAQVAGEAARLLAGTHAKVVAVAGGAPLVQQRLQLRGGCDVLVATPGRLEALVAMRAVCLSRMRLLVLDEADVLLSPGFEAELRSLLRRRCVPPAGVRQVVAAASVEPPGLARRCAELLQLQRPLAVRVGAAAPGGAGVTLPPSVQQRVVALAEGQRERALLQLVGATEGQLTMVFTNTLECGERVHRCLQAEGHAASLLHFSAAQVARDEALQCFKFGVTPVLVAVGPAGQLDLPDVGHVINFDVPPNAREYVKRVGRAGRGGVAGRATTLLCEDAGEGVAAPWLAGALRGSRQPVPEWLLTLAEEHAPTAAAAAGGVGGAGRAGERRVLRSTRGGAQRLGSFLVGPAWAALEMGIGRPAGAAVTGAHPAPAERSPSPAASS